MFAGRKIRSPAERCKMAETHESLASDPSRASSGLHTAVRWVGLLLFLMAGWLYLSSGLLAPIWAVGVLWVVWVVLFVALVRAWRSRPWMVLAAPVIAYVIWAGVMLAGDFFLGWTA